MDTLAHFEWLVQKGKATEEGKEVLEQTVVGGKGGCDPAIESFLQERLA